MRATTPLGAQSPPRAAVRPRLSITTMTTTTANELRCAQLERAGTAMIEAATTAEVKARTAKRQRLDALNRKYHFELNGGHETTLDDIKNMPDEPSVFGTTAQERNFEIKERAAQNKRRAELEGME